MHQPAWALFDAIALAGVEPTAKGYTIDPRLPLRRFSLRLRGVAVTATRRAVRGWIRPTGGGSLRLRVATRLRDPAVTVGGRRARWERQGRFVVFRVAARPGRRATWAVRGREARRSGR